MSGPDDIVAQSHERFLLTAQPPEPAEREMER